MNIRIELLNKLLDKYEFNEYLDGRHTKRPSLSLKLTSKDLPNYYKDITYRDNVDDEIKKLYSEDIIDIKYTKYSDTIDAIYLNLDKVDYAYELTNRKSAIDIINEYLGSYEKYNDNLISQNFINLINDRRSKGLSTEKYFNENYIDALKAISVIEKLDSPIYERNLSNKIFNDSKKLNSIKSYIKAIYSINNDIDIDLFLESKNIINKPYDIKLKGSGIVIYENKEYILDNIKNGLIFPIDDINNIDFKSVTKITTIENETTYYDYKGDGLIMYLGGFVGGMQLNILKKLKEKNIPFYHFGDIDYGGYSILLDLMNKLDIKINTINMNLESLKNNIKYAQEIDDPKYIKSLKSLLNEPKLKDYYDCINYMITNDIWLEQESFYNE